MNNSIPSVEEFINDLGMNMQRMNELIRITDIIMYQEAPIGKTSHVLLGIAGRKDLNDLEKTVCASIFSSKICNVGDDDNGIDNCDDDSGNDGNNDNNGLKNRLEGRPIVELPGIESLGFSKGILVAPPDIEIREMMEMLMLSIKSLAEQLPRDDAIKFYRSRSIEFAKISMTL